MESYVTNVFYNDPYTTCYFAHMYTQPQLLSTHVHLGTGNNTCQNSIVFDLENNNTWVNKAFWVSNVFNGIPISFILQCSDIV